MQLFDSWVGSLSPSDYREYVLPHMRSVFGELRQEGIVSIHFGTGTAGLLPLMAEAGGEVIGVDWRVSLRHARQQLGAKHGIQGIWIRLCSLPRGTSSFARRRTCLTRRPACLATYLTWATAFFPGLRKIRYGPSSISYTPVPGTPPNRKPPSAGWLSRWSCHSAGFCSVICRQGVCGNCGPFRILPCPADPLRAGETPSWYASAT